MLLSCSVKLSFFPADNTHEMRNNRFIKYTLIVSVVTALALVLSCSHQESGDDEDGMQLSDENLSSESSSADQEGSLDAENSTASEDGTTLSESPATNDDSKPPSDEALSELESTVGDKQAEKATPPSEEHPIAEATATNEDGQAAAEPSNLEMQPQHEGKESSLATVEEEKAPEPAVSHETPQTEQKIASTEESHTAPLGVSEAEKPLKTKKAKSAKKKQTAKSSGQKSARGSNASHKKSSKQAKALQAPRIPGRAFVKDGTNLNRFYFVRQGDNQDSVAHLIYGDTTKAQQLTAWNTEVPWKPGLLIYYASPTEAQDQKMLAFYQERNVPVEEHTVESSETLFSIAEANLGDKDSWTEIAAINGLETSGGITEGQKLALYPRDLSSFTLDKSKMLAQAPPPPTTETPDAKPHDASQNQVPPQIPPAPEASKPTAAPKPTKNGMDIGDLVQQNIFAVGIGGVIFVLLIALLAINRKKKKQQGDDFPEESIHTPRARRK